jgi:hypothetical protein
MTTQIRAHPPCASSMAIDLPGSHHMVDLVMHKGGFRLCYKTFEGYHLCIEGMSISVVGHHVLVCMWLWDRNNMQC